ncbi:MAG: AAA family ATPase [Candidatus Hatepunaea meridiana]|nr:AAA family ATPase [Candidatus Hatepunaea meridiana]
MTAKVDFSKIITEAREARSEEKWNGTFLDYLVLVKSDPTIAKLSHQRIYDTLMKPGITEVSTVENPKLRRIYKDDSVKIYDFFADEFFGLEPTINQIVRYFRAAAMKGEESRQVLYLMGPVGSGKSSLVEKIKKALEQNTIYCLEGCPIHEEPLHLVPNHLREKFEELLGIRIEGDLCPVCRWRLKNELDNNYENFKVVTKQLSRRSRIGIGVVPPVDPNNQDTSVLIGGEDISKLDKYSEGDPRVLDLSGALNRGNRGMTEFIEVFKNEVEYLHVMITATQEKVIPAPGRHGMVHVDEVIIAHSNEAEWKKFRADHTNEAILDRIVVVQVPYNMELSEEVKIYNKTIDASDFQAHIAPYTLEFASMFAILTRLEKSAKVDPLTKLKIYNGDEVMESGKTKRIDIQELKEDARREGLSGISTRFIMKALDHALAESDGKCINPINVVEALVSKVKAYEFSDEVRKEYLAYLQDTLHKHYLEILEKEITKAFVYSYKEQAEALFQNYLDHAEAYINKTKVKDPNTREELQPDVQFMRSIEEQIGITGTSADGFRQDVIAFLWSVTRKGNKVDYKSYEPLKEAIEKKLLSSVRDLSRIVTRARTRDNEQQEKYDVMVTRLLENGYCTSCVDTILKYAANNLWRD